MTLFAASSVRSKYDLLREARKRHISEDVMRGAILNLCYHKRLRVISGSRVELLAKV